MRGKTSLLITHRLIGLEHVNEILVMDKGKTVERGTHQALLTRAGLYRRLWALQNQILSDPQPSPATISQI
jgi:ABC-type multidrug transport system fused ATPase/permease subunit